VGEQAARKCLYPAVRPLYPTGKGQVRWAARWKPALNAFAFHFRRPLAGRQGNNENTSYTLKEIDPVMMVVIRMVFNER
jgi:hypothetical protein